MSRLNTLTWNGCARVTSASLELTMLELPWRSDRLGVGATPAKVAVSYTVIAIVWLTMLDFRTVGFNMRTNQQRSCSHWARQRERPWIEGAFPCIIRDRMSCATPSPGRLRREKEEAEYALEGSNRSETLYCVCEGSTYNFCSLSNFLFLNLSCLNDIFSFSFDMFWSLTDRLGPGGLYKLENWVTRTCSSSC